jgi:hypothetical protein
LQRRLRQGACIVDLRLGAEVWLFVEVAGVVRRRVDVEGELPQIAQSARERPIPVHGQHRAPGVGAIGPIHVKHFRIERNASAQRVGTAEIAVLEARQHDR